MQTRIALLRGVNVGGHRMLPMAELRALLAGLGFQNVATYIQSGNAVFAAPGSTDQVGALIRTAINDRFGFDCEVMVLELSDLRDALAANPFARATDDPKKLHLFFLAGPVAALDDAALQNAATKGEQYHLAGQVLYLFTPNGIGRSDLVAKLPRIVGVPMTGRNLRSCQKILELAQAGGGS
jgi:uncharacterized protein (DUF1697 family)